MESVVVEPWQAMAWNTNIQTLSLVNSNLQKDPAKQVSVEQVQYTNVTQRLKVSCWHSH